MNQPQPPQQQQYILGNQMGSYQSQPLPMYPLQQQHQMASHNHQYVMNVQQAPQPMVMMNPTMSFIDKLQQLINENLNTTTTQQQQQTTATKPPNKKLTKKQLQLQMQQNGELSMSGLDSDSDSIKPKKARLKLC